MKRLVLALALVVPACAALAHGDAEWIMRSPDFGWCCGPQDCSAIPNEAVQRVAGGWAVTWAGKTYVVQDGQEFPSIDERFWLCVNGLDQPRSRDGKVCLFVPRMGV